MVASMAATTGRHRRDPGRLIRQQLLVIVACGEQGMKICGSIGLVTCGACQAIFECAEFAIPHKIGDVEVDLGENALDLRGGQFGRGKRVEIGEVHMGGVGD